MSYTAPGGGGGSMWDEVVADIESGTYSLTTSMAEKVNISGASGVLEYVATLLDSNTEVEIEIDGTVVYNSGMIPAAAAVVDLVENVAAGNGVDIHAPIRFSTSCVVRAKLQNGSGVGLACKVRVFA